MKLMRSLKTEVVHEPLCAVKGRSCSPWHWATTRTYDEVIEATSAYPWLHLCRTCLPGACLCGKCRPS